MHFFASISVGLVAKEEELHSGPTNMHLNSNLEVSKDFSVIKLEANLVIPRRVNSFPFVYSLNAKDQGMIIDELAKIFGLGNN